MKNTCLLSEDAKTYLCCYHQLLDGMIQSMTTAGLTQSISRNLIAQMMPHQRSAVQMANNILRFTNNTPTRCLAQRMISEQSQRAEQMESILDSCGRLTNPQTDLRLYQRRMDLIYRDMYAQMGSVPESNRLEAVFLQGMLPHCQGAVRMAENALKYDISTELVPILRSLIQQQRQEAARARALLSRMGCQQR